MERYFDDAGGGVSLLRQIARGGEGTVWRLADDPGRAAKIYHPRTPPEEAKLAWMVRQKMPALPIAWPERLVRDEQGAVAGFLMRLVSDAVMAGDLVQAVSDDPDFADFGLRARLLALRELAQVLDTLHQSEIVVGDLGMRNVLIDPRGRITLIDADGFQVVDRDGATPITYRCCRAAMDGLPPELQTIRLSSVDQAPASDWYGFAVLAFRLLHEGRSPFSSSEEGRVPRATIRLRKRDGAFVPPESSPVPAFEALFRRCFVKGASRPGARPDAAEWLPAIGAELDLVEL